MKHKMKYTLRESTHTPTIESVVVYSTICQSVRTAACERIFVMVVAVYYYY